MLYQRPVRPRRSDTACMLSYSGSVTYPDTQTRDTVIRVLATALESFDQVALTAAQSGPVGGDPAVLIDVALPDRDTYWDVVHAVRGAGETIQPVGVLPIGHLLTESGPNGTGAPVRTAL